jgi:uncharacterized membrane protein
MSSERTKAYTDAVFAIAATLLVLDLTATSIGKVDSDGALWAALAGMWPSIFSFVLSFALLSGLWVVHLRQFRDIAKVDMGLLWLNNARLLFIVLVPFTTSLTDGYQSFLAGRILLPINFFLAALLGYLSWLWAARDDGRLLAADREGDRRTQSIGGLAATICGAIAVVLSPWVGSIAFLAYALNGPITALLTRFTTKRAR